MTTPGAFMISGGHLIGSIGATERQLLQQLLSSIAGMLDADRTESTDPLADLVGWDEDIRVPGDPALRRLLPDGVRDDAEAALEFRRLTERSLRESKAGALRAAALLLERAELRLSRDQGELLARALNDVRLVLAERLHLFDSHGFDSHGLEAAPEAGASLEDGLSPLYSFVSAVHGRLVIALLELLRRGSAKLPGRTGEADPGADQPGPQP